MSERTLATVVQALARIDELTVDTKLEAFGKLLDRLLAAKEAARICILTDYVATLFYLAAEIEARGMKCVVLHGGMKIEDRRESLRSIRDSGDILLATRAAMPVEFPLAEITDVVLYDIPANQIALARSLRGFDRFGRSAKLTIHSFFASNISDGGFFDPREVLHK